MNTVSRKQRQMELEKHENPSKTSTPLHTTDWYVKWVATVVLIIGMILTANNVHPINLFVNIAGLVGWLTVAIMWNDRALIIINAVGVSIYANGVVAYIVKVVENGS